MKKKVWLYACVDLDHCYVGKSKPFIALHQWDRQEPCRALAIYRTHKEAVAAKKDREVVVKLYVTYVLKA